MDQLLAGKVAVVTGGTRGIGRAIAERLLLEGASVAFCGTSPESVARVAGELRKTTGGKVYGEAADVSKTEDVRRFFQSVDANFGPLQVLINNAGLGIFRPTADLSRSE